jgi:hypothetical protein
MEQILFLRGSKRDRRWSRHLYVMPLHHVVDRHEPIEQRIDFIRIRESWAPVPIPCETNTSGIGARAPPAPAATKRIAARTRDVVIMRRDLWILQCSWFQAPQGSVASRAEEAADWSARVVPRPCSLSCPSSPAR